MRTRFVGEPWLDGAVSFPGRPSPIPYFLLDTPLPFCYTLSRQPNTRQFVTILSLNKTRDLITDSLYVCCNRTAPRADFFMSSNYEKLAPRVSQVIAAVANVSCQHGLWLVARVNAKDCPQQFHLHGTFFRVSPVFIHTERIPHAHNL